MPSERPAVELHRSRVAAEWAKNEVRAKAREVFLRRESGRSAACRRAAAAVLEHLTACSTSRKTKCIASRSTQHHDERTQEAMKRMDDSGRDSDASKRLTGFALLPEERRREVARIGGKAAQRSGDVRRWSAQTAREMSPLGVVAARSKRKARASSHASTG